VYKLNITEKKLENSRVELEIEVPVEKVEIEYKSVFENIKKSAKVDGFRKGKAPVQIVEKKYVEYADQEVAENLIKSSVMDAVTEKQLTPITEPQYDFDKIARGESFKFKATIELFPTIELGKYKEVTAEEKVCEVKDDDIAREMDSIRERFADVTKKENDDATVQNGDLAKIKVKRLDDKDAEKEDDEFKEYSIVVGKARDDSALDKHIVGMKAGEEKEVEVKYPKDYDMEDLAGKKIKYLVNIVELSDMKLPDLDDELAKKAQYESLDDMKQKTTDHINDFVVSKTRGEAKARIIKSAVEDSKFDLPESMIMSEMTAIFRKTQERIANQMGFPVQNLQEFGMDEFAEMMGMDPEEFRAKTREEAEQSVKTTLLLSEVAKTEELTVPEEKYKELLGRFSNNYGKPVEEIEEMIDKNGSRENIEQELLLDCAMDFLYDNGKVKKLKPLSLEELLKAQ